MFPAYDFPGSDLVGTFGSQGWHCPSGTDFGGEQEEGLGMWGPHMATNVIRNHIYANVHLNSWLLTPS
jgi:hypothetical protein